MKKALIFWSFSIVMIVVGLFAQPGSPVFVPQRPITGLVAYQNFNTGQFGTNGGTVSIKDGALLTNTVTIGGITIRDSSAPGILFTNSGAASDLKKTFIGGSTSGEFSVSAISDDNFTVTSMLRVGRTGNITTPGTFNTLTITNDGVNHAFIGEGGMSFMFLDLNGDAMPILGGALRGLSLNVTNAGYVGSLTAFVSVTNAAANITMSTNRVIWENDATGGNVTNTLPAVADAINVINGVTNSFVFTVKRLDAAGGNSLIVTATGGVLIDGSATSTHSARLSRRYYVNAAGTWSIEQ